MEYTTFANAIAGALAAPAFSGLGAVVVLLMMMLLLMARRVAR